MEDTMETYFISAGEVIQIIEGKLPGEKYREKVPPTLHLCERELLPPTPEGRCLEIWKYCLLSHEGKHPPDAGPVTILYAGTSIRTPSKASEVEHGEKGI